MAINMEKSIVYEMSQSESLIMNFLWREGAKTFVEIMTYLNQNEGRDWKKQTVNTFIRRLSDKGLISADETGRNRIYYAAVTNAEYEQGKAVKLLNDYYGGSIGSFLSALTGGRGIDRQAAEDLKAIVEREFIQEE